MTKTETINVTPEMMNQAKEALSKMKPDLRDEKYLTLKDFVEYHTIGNVPVFHVTRLAWVFCPEFNGEDFCHIIGEKEHQCWVAAIPVMDERMGLPDCPICEKYFSD